MQCQETGPGSHNPTNPQDRPPLVAALRSGPDPRPVTWWPGPSGTAPPLFSTCPLLREKLHFWPWLPQGFQTPSDPSGESVMVPLSAQGSGVRGI